jgi:hypothetical protein
MARALKGDAMIRLIVGLLVLASASAEAQRRVRPLIGIHYGTPLKWSTAVGIGLVPDTTEGGVFVAAEPGLGGWRASVGWIRLTGNLGTGYVGRVTLLRTERRPWRAPPRATFVGAEYQHMPIFVLGVRLGAYHRLGRPHGARRGLLTAGVSLFL